jgi:PAS domain S-box-containing protein
MVLFLRARTSLLPMDRIDPLRGASLLRLIPHRAWRIASIVLPLGSLALLVAVLLANLERPQMALAVPLALATAILIFALLLAGVFLHLRRKQHESACVLETTEHQLEQMASNIQEIFWMIDAETKQAIRVNQAYETITGRSCQSLIDNPSSYREIIHPDDRAHILAKLDEGARRGKFDERFRIVRPDGDVRWVWVRGFPVRDSAGNIFRLVGTALEITSQIEAEDQVAKNLALAKSAWAEADALRKATLGLTQDLRMNYVLDTLLQSLTELISCEYARVLLLEGDSRLLVAREKLFDQRGKKAPHGPLVLEADEFPLFREIVVAQNSVLMPDTQQEAEWRPFEGHDTVRSWLCVPLIASQQTLGVLSVGHSQPNTFTQEHLRLGNSLAIPAAAAIQNARLYERAAIYGSELEKRIYDLDAAEKAIELAEGDRKLSEDKFHKVFHSSPLPFSITTVDEGRFVDVNSAFELHYGYSRAELIGHTVHELIIWEDPSDFAFMISQLRRRGPIRNAITRLRTKSGEIKFTAYSADWIQFDGYACVFAVTQDVLPNHPSAGN